MRHLKKGLVTVAAVLVFAFLAGWVFLSAAFMAGPRKAVFETILTGKLGRDVRIEGDLRVELGSPLQISAEGLALPSRSMPSLELAEIGSLSFDLPVSKLWAGQIRLTNLQSDGVHLRMVIDENGVRSWDANPTGPDRSKDRSVDVSDPAKALSEILPDQVLTLTNTTVTYQSAIDGLDLNLRLSEIKLDKGDGTTGPTFDSTGDLNGEALTLSGSFPKAEPFQASADFDQIKIAFNGSQSADGFEMKMAADILELGQLLDILKLNRVLEGTGHIGAVLKSAEGIARIDDVSILAALDGGQSLEVSGHLGEMGNPADVSLTTRIRLYSEDNRPPVATSRRDLKLISVDMVIDSVPGQVPQREMVIETNGFVMETSGEGPPPIEFSQISRSPDGILQLGKLNLRIGPPKTPFIVLDGSVKDALQLQGIAAEGLINVAAGSLIAPEQLQGADALGEFSGNFHLDGNINKLTLTNLDGKTQNTDLWDLEVHGTVSNVLKFEDLDLNIDVDVPSGAALLSAMNLDPVDTGQTTLSARLKSHGADWDAQASVNVAESSLDFTLNLDDVTTSPVLRGMIESDLIQLDHLRSIVSAAVSLRGLDQPDDQAPKDGADKAVTEADPKATGPIRDVTLKPIGRAILLSGMDMEVDIDLRKIEGAKGSAASKVGLSLKNRC